MGMSGHKVTGYKYVGLPNLATIGTQIFWYDYRYNYDIIVQSSRDRVRSWRSLGTTGTPLDVPNSVYLYSYSNGFGYVNGDTGSPRNRGNIFPLLNRFHTGGNAWLFGCVVRFDYTSASSTSSSTIISTGGSSTKPGIAVQIINADTPRIRVQINDAANNVIVNWATTLNSFPTGRHVPVAIYYYGDSSASNYNMYIEGTLYSFSAGSPSYSGADCNQWNVGGLGIARNDFKLKLLVGYDLSGKNRTQVDSFVTNFFTTLKNDSEYSSLTTP